MKKIATLFLVLLIVFSVVGCNTTASEETATTPEERSTLNHEDEVDEVVQWTIVNIINKNTTYRFVESYLYDDVKREVEAYICSLPNHLVPTDFSIELISPDLFKIEIKF